MAARAHPLVPALALVLLTAPCVSAEDGGAVSAPAPVLTVNDLVQQIDALDRLAAGLNGEEELRAALGAIPDVWHVQDGDREHVVRVGALVRTARTSEGSWEERRDALRRQLASLRTLVAGDEAAPSLSAAAARDELADVLALAEFAPAPPPGPLARLVQRIRRWLQSLLERAMPERIGTRGLRELLAWLAGAAALVLLTRALLRRPRRPSTASAMADEPAEPWHAWLEKAQHALAAGDTREAVRCAYTAVLLRFAEQGLWDVDESRTPREYAGLVPAGDARRDAFAGLVRQFELTWYGARPADAAALSLQLEGCGCSVSGAMSVS
ncbi:MAG TPA: DUF4129 domain-containing protein [Vicinamibacterales bacterium]